MTETRAIAKIRYRIDTASQLVGNGADGKEFEDLEMAIQALSEIQQYRAIGTIEEFKVLKEKSVAKKAEVNEFDYGEGYVCGECESFLHYVDDDDEHIRTNYCCHCGTKIDWQ